jgi:hypothetical protein
MCSLHRGDAESLRKPRRKLWNSLLAEPGERRETTLHGRFCVFLCASAVG